MNFPEDQLRSSYDDIISWFAPRVGRANADDLAQETFLKAWASREHFDASRDPRPWLFGIARNVFRRYCRDTRVYRRRFRRESDDE